MIKSRMNYLVQWRLLYVQTTRQSINVSRFCFLTMTPVKLVTFDVTGTILSFRTPVLLKYLEIGSKFGVNADPDVLDINFKEAWKTLNEEHPNYGKESGLNWQNWWRRFVEKTFEGCLKREDKNKIAEIAEDLITFHSTKEAFIKKPGVDDLLNYLKTKSIILGIISNYDPRLNQILEIMELKKYFNFVLISYDFGHQKPEVKIFEEALRLGGCNSGEEAIHIGDNLKLDYLGAKEAGLKAILISSDENNLRGARIKKKEVFKDLFELKTYFKEKFKE